jgi:pyridoxamine 5'-phosphate oxidase
MKLHAETLPDPLPQEPLAVARQWLTEAWALQKQPNPNAIVLATSTRDGRPSARVVLCKDIIIEPGYITFYSNYQSRKGRELAENPRAAIVMHWDHLHRQVRIEGTVVTAPVEESDSYFATRPWQRRIAAWASSQSEPVGSRQQLLAAVAAMVKRFGPPNLVAKPTASNAMSRFRGRRIGVDIA